ncbi:hypothetical protein FQN50_009802 [Emmonsiellopsis sp. PD_5]|nr:hypothetical protein FQN50_009802 [Emmonsiellopsis sp. PD_5]
MLPPTIYDSFWEHLENLPCTAVANGYRTISASSISTQNVDTPTAWIAENPSVLINLARSKLPTHPPSTGTLQQRMPQTENTHLLHTEGDVIRASLLYLLHPVNIAASRLLPAGRLYCRGEQSSGGGCRTDVRWVYHNGGQMVNIAVLELKNTKVVHWGDFAHAMANEGNAKAMHDSAQDEPFQSHFKQNAVWLSKQARKYSVNVATDVAIFDWSAIFVFDFSGINEDALNPSLARGIWFSESNSNPNHGHTFRIALLGFLIRALRRHNIIS